MKNILVIGSINVDYVIHTERLPKLGETLTGSDFAMNFGGKGANQAVALAKTGCNVKMLGAVGTDLSGELAINNLLSFGIDCADVMRVDAPTGAAVITVCGGDNHILLDIGANAFVTPAEIEARESLFDWADIVVMQYEIPMESVLFAARMTKKHKKLFVLNPAPVKAADAEIYRLTDIIIPNEFETQLITGISPDDEESTARAIKALRDMGCETVLITLGKRGCAYTDGDDIRYQGIYDIKVVDTTAAGDSFIGGVCKSLCDGKSMEEAVSYASAVSAITVSRKGAGVSIPTSHEVEEFLKKNA
ncbi:MAG: ribokinase [Ruminococcaceae bacterium]|nr:ribokinase [Oscillospiraceae bacterium]